MKSRSGRPVLLLAAVVALGACGFDLTEVALDSDPAPPRLDLDVREDGGSVDVVAHLSPGRTPDGHPRAIQDDSLWLDGVRWPPTNIDANGRRRYDIPGLDAADSPLRFRPPAVPGAGADPPVVIVDVPTIEASDTLVAVRDGTIEIPVLGIDGDYPDDVDGQWMLRFISDAGRRVLDLTSHTPPPPVLRAATRSLPGTFVRGTVVAEGRIWDEPSNTGARYEVVVSRSFRREIPIRIEE